MGIFLSGDFIEEVRSRNDIVDIISEYVSLKPSGKGLFGLCPFHSEKTPSFNVSLISRFITALDVVQEEMYLHLSWL